MLLSLAFCLLLNLLTTILLRICAKNARINCAFLLINFEKEQEKQAKMQESALKITLNYHIKIQFLSIYMKLT